MPSTSDDSIVISVRLPRVLLEQIDQRAERERRPRANLVRLLLEQAMERTPEESVRKADSRKR
jgi:metal-responsive CopG/Arc/MetJ family transcriptional regulator